MFLALASLPMVMSTRCIKHHTVFVFICALCFSFFVFLFYKYILFCLFFVGFRFSIFFSSICLRWNTGFPWQHTLWANTFIHVLNMPCIIWAGYVAFSLPLGGYDPFKTKLIQQRNQLQTDAIDSLQFSLVHSSTVSSNTSGIFRHLLLKMIALFQPFSSTDRPTE